MTNYEKNFKKNYEAPTLEIVEVKIEQGFAGSNAGSSNEGIGNRFEDMPW